MHVQIFTVCTELMLSVHRADCERATQPYSSGGGVRFFQAQDQPSATHVRVGNRVFYHSLDVVSKMHIYTLYTVIFFTCTISETLFKFITHCFCCLLRCVEFSRSLTMSMHNVARLSVLHYATVAHAVNTPGKSMSMG